MLKWEISIINPKDIDKNPSTSDLKSVDILEYRHALSNVLLPWWSSFNTEGIRKLSREVASRIIISCMEVAVDNTSEAIWIIDSESHLYLQWNLQARLLETPREHPNYEKLGYTSVRRLLKLWVWIESHLQTGRRDTSYWKLNAT